MEPQTQAAAELPTLLQPQWALALLVLALVFSLGIRHLARLPGLRRIRHWLLLGRALVWALVIFNVVFAMSRWLTADHWLPLGVLAIALLGFACLDWLRNVIAGLALDFERHFQPGQLVRCGDVEGELVELSTRAVTLRADDGTLHQIPNEKFTRESVTHLEADGEAACEIVVSVPDGIDPDRARSLARQAAFLTPLAAPRHRPEVFLDVARGDSQAGLGAPVTLRIRGYAFDPGYRAHYRSDVVARVHDLLRTEQADRA